MRESKTLEFKETITSNSFLKTISAYANYDGGRIIFGISDNGDIKGIEEPIQACLALENKINDNIKPTPSYTLEIQSDHTIILEVSAGQFKPYFYKNKAFKRNDSSTLEVERLELNRLILDGKNQSFESVLSEKQDLKFNVLEKELIHVLGIQHLHEDILRILDLYTTEMKFNNAAALLADENQFKGVDIIRFGESFDEIMDREILEHLSILSLLKKTVDMYKKYYQYEKIEETSRTLIEKIPEKAFREAVANALIHRLWDVPAIIRISMYSDKIEITSPGGLPPGLSKDEYLNGQISLLRNPIIGNLFFRLRYIEKFGTGILRINRAYAQALTKPEYRIFDNSITIILPTITSLDKLTADEIKIVNALKGNLKLSRIELEKQTTLNKDKTIRLLNILIDKHILTKQGAGRVTRYYLL